MYQDAGYGENWQPGENNARRLDPYSRPCLVLISLFAIGFVLIIIVVLSLIPIYISQHGSKTTNNVQAIKISISNYNLRLQSSVDTFNPQNVLSDANNRLTLQAALTSMLQKDSSTVGAVVDIDSSTHRSNPTRRQTSDSSSLTFDLAITSNRTCAAAGCSRSFQTTVINLFSSKSNGTTSFVRYQQSNITQWLVYQLPETIDLNVSFISVNPTTITALLNSLISIDKTENQLMIDNSTSSPVG